MRIAVTADAHLTTIAERPERYRALENVFEQTRAADIDHLIIAGDLFDKDSQNYAEFEALCRQHPDLTLHIIPGNHDPNISGASITGANVNIYTDPTVVPFDSVPFLFVPYAEHSSMGQKIAEMEPDGGAPWVLVGHGDFHGGVKEPNPHEPGTYMPLSRQDVIRFAPRTVFLGHIHKPHEPHADVHYAGSPCGLDISETGRRRFLIYDTEAGNVEERPVETDVLYFVEDFLVLPREDEVALMSEQISRRIEGWGVTPDERSKVRVRVTARGYAKDRSAVLHALTEGFDGFAFEKDDGPRIEELSSSSDDQLATIAEGAIQRIEGLDWPFGPGEPNPDEPTRDEVELAALKVIYGG